MTAISMFSVHEDYEKIVAIRARQNITFSFHFRSAYVLHQYNSFTCLTPHLQLNIIRKVIKKLFYYSFAGLRSDVTIHFYWFEEL